MLLCTCMSLVAIAKPVYLNPYCASAARLMEHGIGIRDAALPAHGTAKRSARACEYYRFVFDAGLGKNMDQRSDKK